jgi:hypothetical protein
MKFSAVLSCLVVIVAASLSSQSSAETVQTAATVNGWSFLYVEGESASTITGAPGTTWAIATKGGPEMSFVSGAGVAVPIMPATTNASGDKAIYSPTNNFGAVHTSVAQYQLKFITAGTYQFFLRQSLYDTTGNGNFLNEDSIFLPPEFNKNTDTDWTGFQSEQFDENDLTVDIPIPGDSLDPDGWKPEVGDHERDGLLELANWGIKDDNVWVQHTPTEASGVSANGKFSWYNRPAYQGTNQPGNTFAGFFGLRNQFTVTPAMVGQTVTFDLALREVNVAIDGFMFLKSSNVYPDGDLLDVLSQAEVDAAVLPVPPAPVAGDYNGNGKVDGADYVLWRNGGPLANEVDTPGTVNAADYTEWRAGYGNPPGSGAGSSAIPEPATMALFILGLAALQMSRRRQGR